MSIKYWQLYQFCYVKLFSTNYNENLVLLDDPGRARSQITSVVCQIQRFDFDSNLVVTRKLIIRTCAPLRLKPLYLAPRLSPQRRVIEDAPGAFLFNTKPECDEKVYYCFLY